MRRRLLPFLLMALTACLGSECSGGGSGGNSSAAGSPDVFAAATANGDEGTFVAPVPEPSAALVFSVGLLIAGALARRSRQ